MTVSVKFYSVFETYLARTLWLHNKRLNLDKCKHDTNKHPQNTEHKTISNVS